MASSAARACLFSHIERQYCRFARDRRFLVIAVTATTDTVFRELFDAESAYVYGSLRRLGVRGRDLEDLTQEVFLSVYQRLDVYDRSRPIRPWLFAFVYRVVCGHRRQLVRHRADLLDEEPLSCTGNPEEEITRAEATKRLSDALESLSPELRAVFVMHELDEFTGPEIADVIEVPLNTVYSRIRLARRAIEAALDDDDDAGGAS